MLSPFIVSLSLTGERISQGPFVEEAMGDRTCTGARFVAGEAVSKQYAKMTIWVDADACPVVIKEILFRAAGRTGVQTTLVANQTLAIPLLANISFVLVASGPDVADREIVKRMVPGDLVITSDIPLAADVLEKGGHALSPRGELHSVEDIGARLSLRDFMETLRADGVDTGGPPPLNKGDRQAFAKGLDRFLTGYVVQASCSKVKPPPW